MQVPKNLPIYTQMKYLDVNLLQWLTKLVVFNEQHIEIFFLLQKKADDLGHSSHIHVLEVEIESSVKYHPREDGRG